MTGAALGLEFGRANVIARVHLAEQRALQLKELLNQHEQDLIVFRLWAAGAAYARSEGRGEGGSLSSLHIGTSTHTTPAIPSVQPSPSGMGVQTTLNTHNSSSNTIPSPPSPTITPSASPVLANLPPLRGSTGSAGRKDGPIRIISNNDMDVDCPAPSPSSSRTICFKQHRSRLEHLGTLELGGDCNVSAVPSQTEDELVREMPTVLPMWEARAGESRTASLPDADALGRTLSMKSQQDPQGRTGDILADNCCLRHFILYPTDWRRIIWDMLSVVVILWDMLTLPLGVFSFDSTDVASVSRKVTTTFWSCDLVCSFFVGYHLPDGRIDLRFRRIARNYIRSWFPLDALVVSTDLVLMFIDLNGSSALDIARVGKTARAARVARCFRMVRLVRLMKLMQVIEQLSDVVLSGPFVALFNICKLMVGLAVIVHFIACAWYAVGIEMMYAGQTSWLSMLAEEGASDIYFYLVSYHWTMSQFTPAPSNYHPMNAVERAFAILVLFVGLVLFSSLLGSTTALLNQSRKEAFARMKDNDNLRRFLFENQVSLKIGNQILHFTRSNPTARKLARVSETDVPCLKTLPVSLQMHLRYEVYAPRLVSPGLAWLRASDNDAMSDVCANAVDEVVLRKGEEIFFFQQAGKFVHFVSSGTLIYYKNLISVFGMSGEEPSNKIKEGRYLAEGVLWTSWYHCGLLSVESNAGVLRVHGKKFREAVMRSENALRSMRVYVGLFTSRLQVAWNRSQGEEVDDEWSAFLHHEDVINAMPKRRTSSNSKSRPAGPDVVVSAAHRLMEKVQQSPMQTRHRTPSKSSMAASRPAPTPEEENNFSVTRGAGAFLAGFSRSFSNISGYRTDDDPISVSGNTSPGERSRGATQTRSGEERSPGRPQQTQWPSENGVASQGGMIVASSSRASLPTGPPAGNSATSSANLGPVPVGTLTDAMSVTSSKRGGFSSQARQAVLSLEEEEGGSEAESN